MNTTDSSLNQSLEAITAKLQKGTKDIYTSDSYMHYLKVMSHFHHYSTNNSILIFAQKPEATYIAGYQTWKRDFHRHVKAGEKGIRILIPIQKKTETAEEKDEYLITGFKCGSVFDISQTEGESLPFYMKETLDGDVKDYDEFRKALILSSPVPVAFKEIGDPKLHGLYRVKEKQIIIDSQMSNIQTVKTLLHEIAHATMHQTNRKEGEQGVKEREIQAESVAYCVSAHYGIDTSAYSFPYIAGWSSSRELEELQDSLDVIRKTADSLISVIDTVVNTEKQRKKQNVYHYAMFL